MVKLSIIIVNFRSAHLLPECLFSIREKILNRADSEIIIVNNDACENLENIKEKFPEVIIIDNEKNVGYGQACNIGAKVAGGEILLFLNPDTKILSDNISEVLNLSNSKSVAIIGSGLVTEDGESQKWCAGEDINIWNLVKNNLGLAGDNKIINSKKPLEVAWVTGAAMFVKKDIFEALSGFDGKFFMYFEDVDLCKRIKIAGYKIVYNPLFQVFHRGGESHLEKKEQKENYYTSQEYYFKKHCGAIQAALLKILRKIFI
ncbi:MAG: glycosyltransferase family 2 protein [Parcubacteria group bacterium]